MDNHAQISLFDDSHLELSTPPQPRDEIVTTPIAQPTPSASDLVSDVSETSPNPASVPDCAKASPAKRIAKPAPKDDERYLSVKEVATRYSVSVQTVWRHTKDSPDFPKPVKVLSGSTRWKHRDLIAYEASRQEGA